MFGRSDKLEKELREKRARAEEEEAAAASSEGLAEADEAQLQQLAADEAAGKLTSDQVAKRLDEIAAGAKRHRLNADHHRRVAALVRDEIAELERQVEAVPFEHAAAKLPAAADSVAQTAALFATRLAALVKTGRELERKRATLDKALAEAEELCPEWRELDFQVPDEAEWPDDVDALVELLQAGPRQPAKRSANAREKQDVERRKGEEQAIAAAIEERARYLNAAREKDEELLRSRWSSIPQSRYEEVLDRIAAEREQLRADFEKRRAAAANPPVFEVV